MIGWRYVGRITNFLQGYHSDEVELELSGRLPEVGDLIALSPFREGTMRCGLLRVRDVEPYEVGPRVRFGCSITTGITGAAVMDHVFVATAIGEDAFRRRV